MVWSHLKPSTNPPPGRRLLSPTPTQSLNYSCAPQNPTKDLLRCRYGGWWWHLVWMLHNYWQVFFPLSCRCERFKKGLLWGARMWDSENNSSTSRCVFVWKCCNSEMVVLILCWFLPTCPLGGGTYIILSSLQTPIHPPGVRAKLKAMFFIFLLSLQWVAEKIIKRP